MCTHTFIKIEGEKIMRVSVKLCLKGEMVENYACLEIRIEI